LWWLNCALPFKDTASTCIYPHLQPHFDGGKQLPSCDTG
jgi:hypothetical protein